MKAFFQVIADFFENMDGSGSSRRLAGLSLIVCGIVGGFQRLDTTFCLGLVTGGVTLLGLTTVDDHAIKPVISTSGFMRTPDAWTNTKITTTTTTTPNPDQNVADNNG